MEICKYKCKHIYPKVLVQEPKVTTFYIQNKDTEKVKTSCFFLHVKILLIKDICK
jgi:hypothetical protein